MLKFLIEIYETENIIKNVSASLSIKHTRFPLTMSCASNVHKVQDLSLQQGVTDFELQKPKSLGPA